MGLINPILVNKTDANDATAVGGSAGSLVYQINTTTNRCDTFIYYQAYAPTTAIINGSVLVPATSDGLTPGASNVQSWKGTAERSDTANINGLSAASWPFFGIAQASMTTAYYGYAQRTGYCATVNTGGVTTVVGDVLTVSATVSRATQFLVIATSSPTGTLVEKALHGTLGTVLVGAATSTSKVMLSPVLNLVGG